MSRAARVGIFGGTFNPIHLGHLHAAEEVVGALGLERMLFVPSGEPPHKTASQRDPIAPAELRLAWTRAATAGNPRFAVEALEVERGGTSYSVETLRTLGKQIAPDLPVFVDRGRCVRRGRNVAGARGAVYPRQLRRDHTTWKRRRHEQPLAPGARAGRLRAGERRSLGASPRGRNLGAAARDRSPRHLRLRDPRAAAQRTLGAVSVARSDLGGGIAKQGVRRVSGLTGRRKALLIAEAARERLAEDVVALDVREAVSFADTFVVATGRSDRHVQSIGDGIAEALAQTGEKPLGIEGYQEGRWLLMDFSDVIVHVFQPDVRRHYDLERLWSEASPLDVSPKAKSKRVR